MSRHYFSVPVQFSATMSE